MLKGRPLLVFLLIGLVALLLVPPVCAAEPQALGEDVTVTIGEQVVITNTTSSVIYVSVRPYYVNAVTLKVRADDLDQVRVRNLAVGGAVNEAAPRGWEKHQEGFLVTWITKSDGVIHSKVVVP